MTVTSPGDSRYTHSRTSLSGTSRPHHDSSSVKDGLLTVTLTAVLKGDKWPPGIRLEK